MRPPLGRWAGLGAAVGLALLLYAVRATLSHDLWTWIGVFLTVAVFSFLYRENRLFRFAEHLVVGVANGYGIAFTVHRVLVPYAWKPLVAALKATAAGGISWSLLAPGATATFFVLVPVGVGLLYFARFVPRRAWLVRIPMAVYMGYYTGQYVAGYVTGVLFPQLRATIVNRATLAGGIGPAISMLLIFVGVVSTMTYFFFSREHKGVLRFTARLGIVYVMVGFGASFGFTVMARVSLAIGRFYFLFRDWLGILK
jgi:hypothetical protein